MLLQLEPRTQPLGPWLPTKSENAVLLDGAWGLPSATHVLAALGPSWI